MLLVQKKAIDVGCLCLNVYKRQQRIGSGRMGSRRRNEVADDPQSEVAMKGEGKRFIYYPWRKNQGAKVVDITKSWDEHYNERYLAHQIALAGGEFNYDGPSTSNIQRYELVTNDDPDLSGVGYAETTQIYIWGHGSAGLTTITPYDDPDSWGKIEAEDLSAKLISKFKLTGNFFGQVKLYVCESGIAPSGSLSFGVKFAREFYKTCPKAKVFAYKTSVSMRHDYEAKDPGAFGNTKFKAAIGEGDKKLGRASSVRFEIVRRDD